MWRVPNGECQGIVRDQCLTREVDFLGVQVKMELYPQSCQTYSRPVLRLQNPEHANVGLTFKVVWNGRQLLNNTCIERDRYWEHASNIQAEDFEIHISCFDPSGRHVLQYSHCKSELEDERQRRERSEAEVARCHALINAGSDQATLRARRFACSAEKIQSKWRQVLTRRWDLRNRSERAWRLKQTKCQAETRYDAVLVSCAQVIYVCLLRKPAGGSG